MTIIACSKIERVMGADTLLIDEGEFTILGHVPKIVKCKDGAVAGAAGSTSDCVEFLRWAKAGRKGKAKRRWFKKMQGLILDRKGRVLVYDAPDPDIMDDDFYAIGCGASIARGRRTSGATVRECVEAAIQVSLACGGKAMTMELD